MSGAGDPPGDHGSRSEPRVLHPATLRAGDRFGRYTIVRRIGVGGMGAVYLADQEELERPVALKLLLGADERAARRFIAEARGQARVEHPAVCRVYEAGEINGQRFIAMRFVEGQTLDQARDRMTVEQKVQLLQQICEGIEAAHLQGLVHRDIKPTNVIVAETDDGRWQPFVTDFGLVKDLAGAAEGLTETGIPLGSPSFMAPEQARGEPDSVDRRTDVYALGATLYDLLCGAPPFVGTTPMEIILKVVQADAPPLRTRMPQVSPDLEAVVMRCLEREPARRYATARELAEDLGCYLDGRPVRARPVGWIYEARRTVRRHKLLMASSAVALLIVGSLLGFAVQTQRQAARQAELAQQRGQEVKDIEWSMRAAHLSPPHDITAEKQAVQEQVERLHVSWDGSRRGESGPVEYALGRGALALGDVSAAEEHLQRAWDSGYQSSEVAYGLGLALAMQYQRERNALAAIDNPSLRQARQAEIEERYRTPAMSYLGSVEESDAPSYLYVEALLAYHDGEVEWALDRLAAVSDGAPWFYEAWLLEGRAHTTIAADARHAGHYEEALRSLERARAAFERAAEVGRSDPGVQIALCQADTLELRVRGSLATPADGVYERGVAACELAALIDPHDPVVAIRTGALHRINAFQSSLRGEEALPGVQLALDASQRALVLAPEHPEALQEHALDLRLRGEVEAKAGQDPTATYRAAIEEFERALAADPASARAHLELAGAYFYLVEYQRRHGQDPAPALEAGIAAVRRAIEINPGVGRYHANLGFFLVWHADAVAGDLDRARTLTDQAVTSLEEAVRLNPSSASTLTKLGMATVSLAEMDRALGKDPIPLLDEAIAVYLRASELNPKLYWAHNNLYIAMSKKASYQFDHGVDPIPVLEQGLAALERAIEVDPTNHSAFNNRCDGLALLAERRWAAGEDCLETLAEARSAVDRSLVCRPGYPMSLANRALVATLEARESLGRGVDPSVPLGRGRVDIGRALEIDPDQPEYILVGVRLDIIEARWLMARGEDPSPALDRAEDQASRALEIRDFQEVRETLARIHLRRGQSRPQEAGPSADEDYLRGLELLDSQLQRDPDDPGARAIRATLLLARSDAAGDAGEGALLREEGQELLDAALRDNPYLRREWGGLE
jgi:eukaryotic-like serine/threonine-protein kinase